MSDLNSKDHGWLYDDKLRGNVMARPKKYTIEQGKDGPRRDKWTVVMEDPDAKHMEIVCICYQEQYAQKIHALFANAPPEVTKEMVRAALAVEYEDGVPVSRDIGFGMMRLMLEAALATVPKEKNDQT